MKRERERETGHIRIPSSTISPQRRSRIESYFSDYSLLLHRQPYRVLTISEISLIVGYNSYFLMIWIPSSKLDSNECWIRCLYLKNSLLNYGVWEVMTEIRSIHIGIGTRFGRRSNAHPFCVFALFLCAAASQKAKHPGAGARAREREREREREDN